MKIKKKGTNPEYINEFSTALLDGFYLQDGETFDDALARSAEAFCFGDYDLAQRIYEAAWNGWFMFASPILSNAPKGEWNTKNGRLGMRDEDLWKFLSSHTLEQKKDPNFNLTTSFVGDDPRSMPISCLTGDMPINTYNGIKYMSDLEVGDLVLTHAGNWKPVEEIWTRHSTDDLYEMIIGTRSTKVKITGNHPVKTNLGWVPVAELDANKHLVAVNNVVQFKDSQYHKIDLSTVIMPEGGNSTSFSENVRPMVVDIDEDLSWALGLWFAEGSVARDNKGLGNGLKITMSIDELDIVQEWLDIMSSKFAVNGNYSVVTDGNGNSWCNGWISGCRLARFFDEEFGKNAKTKEIPEWIIDLPKDFLHRFLSGFVDGDGSIDVNFDAKITISNPYLLGGLYNIALKLGHPVSMNFTGKKSKLSTTRYVYSLTLREWQLSRNKKTVSAGIEFEDGLVYCPIRSISKLYNNETVYDIRVSDDHSFSVGGIVVHNCFAMYVPDTIDGQMDANKELAALSVAGGGVGLHNGIRATSDKAPGPIPYMKTMDGLIGYYQQSKNRRGACAYYMDISHPDIIEHIRFRVPSGGDSARKSDNRKQFHSAVNVTDEFIQAVLADEMFNLVDPHSNEVREVIRARDIWEELLEVRALTGEPYIFKIDTANRALPQTQKDKGLKINGSNICVTPETPILTDKGHLPIGALDGLTVNVWNGEEFTETTVHKTGDLEHVIRVNTSKGHFIDCTPMHSFYVVRSYGKNAELVKAHELQPGDKLEKCDMPVIEGERTLFRAYTNGFYTGDGCEVKGRSRIYLYDQKQALAEDIEGVESWTVQEDFNRMYGYAEGLQEKYFIPDATYTIASRVKWLAGLMDSDGTLLKTGKSQSETVQIGSANLPFLQDVQLMLQTLGVDANISLMRERGSWLLPANDWTGELKEFDCEEVNRLLISSYDLYRLSRLGLSCNRLQISGRKPQREAKVFNAIVSVEDYSRVSDVYCFTESGRNKGIFGGILTGQCIEITLPTSEDRTFVCCLSSLNLEKYDEWADTTLVADLVRYLDNVIQFFIEKAPDSLEKAKISAAKERAIGIGTMGWHHYLQSKGIPFEGGGFGSGIQETHKIFSHIKAQAVAESEKLAIERGEPEDMVGSGRRNSHLFAIAPNSNNSVILGTSPSIEPVSGNTYSQSTRAGTFTVKNPYLDKLLYSIALGLDGIFEPDEWVTEQWRDIIAHDGSVQHLEYLSIEEKEVFKTAFEIDQHWLIEQADARQQYVCQSQSLNLFFPSGVSRTYYNSVHLKALTSEYVKSLYYSRMERGINADVVKEIERKVIEDWAGDDCVACSG